MLFQLVKEIKKIIKLALFRSQWQKKYPGSDITPQNIFDLDIVKAGKWSYGELNVVAFSNKSKLVIGNCVSIAQNVSFVLDGEHYLNHISTFPFKVKVLKNSESESFSKGDIIVDDDVWVGYGATIMSGVHIGQGAVVAAGAVVTKDVPPYAIVGGVPAKVIKYRFEPEMIEELLKIDYSKLTKEEIEKHIDDLYVELKDKRQLDWMPKIINEDKK